MNKAKEYLTSIGLENVIGEEFFNDDDKSWYKVEELMESYHQSKLSNIGRSKVDSAVAGVNGDYTNVSLCTDHGDREKTAVESALASTPEDGNSDTEIAYYVRGNWYFKTCHNHLAK